MLKASLNVPLIPGLIFLQNYGAQLVINFWYTLTSQPWLQISLTLRRPTLPRWRSTWGTIPQILELSGQDGRRSDPRRSKESSTGDLRTPIQTRTTSTRSRPSRRRWDFSSICSPWTVWPDCRFIGLGQLFKAFGNNLFAQISYILR